MKKQQNYGQVLSREEFDALCRGDGWLLLKRTKFGKIGFRNSKQFDVPTLAWYREIAPAGGGKYFLAMPVEGGFFEKLDIYQTAVTRARSPLLINELSYNVVRDYRNGQIFLLPEKYFERPLGYDLEYHFFNISGAENCLGFGWAKRDAATDALEEFIDLSPRLKLDDTGFTIVSKSIKCGRDEISAFTKQETYYRAEQGDEFVFKYARIDFGSTYELTIRFTGTGLKYAYSQGEEP